MKGCGWASPIVFVPRTLVRTWGTSTELWDPEQAGGEACGADGAQSAAGKMRFVYCGGWLVPGAGGGWVLSGPL